MDKIKKDNLIDYLETVIIELKKLDETTSADKEAAIIEAIDDLYATLFFKKTAKK